MDGHVCWCLGMVGERKLPGWALRQVIKMDLGLNIVALREIWERTYLTQKEASRYFARAGYNGKLYPDTRRLATAVEEKKIRTRTEPSGRVKYNMYDCVRLCRIL